MARGLGLGEGNRLQACAQICGMSVFLRFRSVAVGSAAGTPSAESYMYRVIGANARCTGSSVRTLHAHYMHTRSAQTSPRPRQHQTRQTRSDQTDPNLDISHKVKTTPPITKQHTTLRTIIPTTNLSLKHPVPLITIPILLDRTKTTHLSMYISAARTQRRIPHVLAEAAVSNAAAAVADRQPQRGISVEARGKRSLNRATTRRTVAAGDAQARLDGAAVAAERRRRGSAAGVAGAARENHASIGFAHESRRLVV